MYTLPPDAGGMSRGLGGQSGILRKGNSPIWISQATLTEARKIAPLEAEIVFREGQNEFRLSIAVDESTNDLLIGQDGVSDAPGVYGIQWGCGNLDIRNLKLILPAGRLLTRHIQMLQEVLAIRALGKRNLQLFRESMAVFSFAVQTRHFSLRNSAIDGI